MSTERMMMKLHQGPRLKSDATKDLEAIAKAFLNEPDLVSCRYNMAGELEIIVNNNTYNLSKILENKPDFEQLQFNDNDLEKYQHYVKNDAGHKPKLEGVKGFPKPEDYKDNQKQLNFSEKIAITIYTSSFYRNINNFLRSDGKLKSLKNSSQHTLKKNVKEILLCACIASHGISKPLQEAEYQSTLYRQERSGAMQHVLEKRKGAVENQDISREAGFTSTSSSRRGYDMPGFLGFDTVTYITPAPGTDSYQLNPLAKRISDLSNIKQESEVLYPPGTQFVYSNYTENPSPEKKHEFVSHAVRSIDNVDPFSYSSKESNLRSKLLDSCQQLIKYEKSIPHRLASFFSHSAKSKEERKVINEMISDLKKLISNIDKKQGMDPVVMEKIAEDIRKIFPEKTGKLSGILNQMANLINNLRNEFKEEAKFSMKR